MAEQNDQRQLAQVFGSLMAAKSSGEDTGQDPQAEYYKQRDKYEKRRMISSIVAPIAGQFLGNLVAAPFREPVSDFLETQKGRDLYGQWAAHQGEKAKVDALTNQMEKFDGSGVDYFRNLNKERYDTELQNSMGEKWYQEPSMQAIAQNYNTRLDTVSRKEYNEYLSAVDYYKLFPDRATFMDNIKQYGPRSSNLGQAVYRRIKRAISGQSAEEYTEQAILNITGVNSHIFAQKMNDPFVTSDDVSMDVETFREAIDRSISPISSEGMLSFIQKSQEEYMKTPYGEQRTFENQLQLANERSQRNLFVQMKEKLLTSIQLQAYHDFVDSHDGTLPTQDQLYYATHKALGIELVNNDALVKNEFESAERFAFFRDGGEVISDDGETTYFAGVNEALFNSVFNNATRSVNVEWQRGSSIAGNIDNATSKFPNAQASFDNAKTLYFDQIIATAKDMQSIMLSSGQIQDFEFLTGPDAGRRQKHSLLELSEMIINNHVQRDDMEGLHENSLWSSQGTRPMTVDGRMITGIVNSDEAVNSIIERIISNSDLETAEQGDEAVVVDGLSIEDILRSGSPLTKELRDRIIEEFGEYDQDIAVPADYSGLDKQSKTSDYFTRVSTIGKGIDRKDSIQLIDPLTGKLEPALKEQYDITTLDGQRQAGRDVIFNATLGNPNYDQLSWEEKTNLVVQEANSIVTEEGERNPLHIPGTQAANYTLFPLYRTIEVESQPPFEIKNVDGSINIYKIGLAGPIMRGEEWKAIEANAGGPPLSLSVGKMVREELSEGFVLGRATDLTTEKPPGLVFQEIVSAREQLQAINSLRIPENFDKLPSSFKEFLGQLSGTGYIPNINRLRELGVPEDKVVNRLWQTYLNKDGSVKGEPGSKEYEINSIRFQNDVALRSVNVPYLDKAGEEYLRGIPLMHDMLVNAHRSSAGFENEDEASFYQRLSETEGDFLTDVRNQLDKLDFNITLPKDIQAQRQDQLYQQQTANQRLSDNTSYWVRQVQRGSASVDRRINSLKASASSSILSILGKDTVPVSDKNLLNDLRTYHYNRLDITDKDQANLNLDIMNDSIILAESSNDFNAKNPNSTASGGYQFVEESAKTAARRVINSLGNMPKSTNVPQWVQKVASGKLKVLDLTPIQQRILFEGDMFERKGSDALVLPILRGDREAITSYYYDFHHSDPDGQPGTRSNWVDSFESVLSGYEIDD